jgi:hypothetical protein
MWFLLLLGVGGLFEPTGKLWWELEIEAVKSFGFDDTVNEDIFWVSERAGVRPSVLASIVEEESGGERGVFSYCLEWELIEGGKRCVKQASCYSWCKPFWKDHLDVGLWGLRDAPEPAFSWLRKYNAPLPKRNRLRSTCTLNRECSRELMAYAMIRTKEVAPRTCGRYSGCYGELAWLSRWNGCSSCGNHVRQSGRALLSAFLKIIP